MTNITAKIIADSITDGGARLTTWEWTYPRMIHAEIMTHRALSRNAASSRAIPAAKLRERTLVNPAVPVHWGANQKGMQATEEINAEIAEEWWREAMVAAAAFHQEGEDLGLHKQIVNRIIEPWMMITVIVSGTDWANFFHLRDHKDAEPNFQVLAKQAHELYFSSMPTYTKPGEWHLPFITDEDQREARGFDLDLTPGGVINLLKKVSVGRCARVSYLTHDGKRDLSADVELHDKLAASADAGDPMHASPFEHVSQAHGRWEGYRYGNFTGWHQYRKEFEKENGPKITSWCEVCGLWNGQHVKGTPQKTCVYHPDFRAGG